MRPQHGVTCYVQPDSRVLSERAMVVDSRLARLCEDGVIDRYLVRSWPARETAHRAALLECLEAWAEEAGCSLVTHRRRFPPPAGVHRRLPAMGMVRTTGSAVTSVAPRRSAGRHISVESALRTLEQTGWEVSDAGVNRPMASIAQGVR